MIAFDAAHKAVHYPLDRRFRIWIRPSLIVVVISLALIPLALAWGQRCNLRIALSRSRSRI